MHKVPVNPLFPLALPLILYPAITTRLPEIILRGEPGMKELRVLPWACIFARFLGKAG